MITRHDIIVAYQMILGREPESEDAIEHHLRAHASLGALRAALFHSQERVQSPIIIDDFCFGVVPARYGSNNARYRARGGECDSVDAELYMSLGGGGDPARYYLFNMAHDLIRKENIQGNLAELGVYRGATAALLARTARRLDRQLFLLDTFEGFPKEDLIDLDESVDVQFTDTSLDAVRAAVGEEHVTYVQGRFPETAEVLPEGQYALVHLDCDLYQPIYAALTYFWPRLSPGGFMIVHDYMSMYWDGAEKAVDSYFEGRSEFVVPIPDTCGTAVIRKSRS